GGRAIVWGDIALIDGNINAQGSGDIAKTGGFVETSGHDLFIKDNAIVDAKEWLLDPDEVTISTTPSGRSDNEYSEDASYTGLGTSPNTQKQNKDDKTTLTNTTLENILARGSYVNITAKRKINVTSDINLSNGSLTLWSEGKNGKGLEINGNITANGNNGNANLTIYSGGWLDIHSNISLREGDNINITAKGDIAFEQGRNQTIKGQGTITSGNQKGFRFENVSLNGLGSKGLRFTSRRGANDNGNITNHFNGSLNISGKIDISMRAATTSFFKRYSGRTHWNVSILNVSAGSSFNLSIDSSNTNAGTPNKVSGLNGITFERNTIFNVSPGSTVNFSIKAPIAGPKNGSNYALFNGDISVRGGGNVSFKLNASSSTFKTPGVIIKSRNFNVSEGSSLNLDSQGSTETAFLIENDLTLNATNGNITLKQIEGTDSHIRKGVVAKKNITFEGGNITFGSQKAPTEIKGNVTVKQGTNVTLRSANFNSHTGALTVGGSVTANGNLTADGDTINIVGNLTVGKGVKFKGSTKNNLNITGTFTNDGDSEINISQGAVSLGNITNNKSLSITTNAKNGQKSIIRGDIINKQGNLNITDNNSNAEIEIGGNISQKEGNLTISSDKINITKRIEIKAGTDQGNSDSGVASNANLTIKTKELKLTENLNISGFDKAEIVAKENNNLIIGNNNGDNANAKTVTFNNVKDSKISANGHNVTLNSKVETSDGNSNTEGNSDNNAGLTIDAKNVTVNNDITSHKTVNITASERIDTKADTTINATTGNVKLTAVTSDIQGGIKSNSGDVNITTSTGSINGKIESKSGSVTLTATEKTLTVGNVSGNTVTVTANRGALTTLAGSTINGTNGVTTSSQSGEIGGEVTGKTVSVTATAGSLTVKGGAKINATEGTATLTASSGKLTTEASSNITSAKGQVDLSAQDGSIAGQISAANVTLNTTGTLTTVEGSSINANEGTLVINANDAKLDGKASGDRTVVNATNASGSGSVTAVTSSNVNITGD
ncbi:beta strand repeat-containing protein, partial [Haemophilus influenzae]|uniref:beta strand repeat-containing protein n=1 Tax=Haemophilus influenzae TaxID=727 RepID=UPI00358F3F30